MRLLVLLILVVGGIIHAQTPEPTIITEARLLFPERLLLEAALPLPATEVAEVRLSISVPGQPVIAVAYPADQSYRFAQEFVVANYDYSFPTQSPIAPFVEVLYRWTARLANGQQLAASGSVIYQDDRVVWQELVNGDDLAFYIGHGALARPNDELADTAALMARLEAETGQALRARWVFYPPEMPPFCARFDVTEQPAPVPRHRYFWAGEQRDEPCDPTLAQRVYEANGYRVVGRDAETLAGLRRVLVEQAYAPIWPPSAPAWFREGIIGLYVPRRVDDVGIVRQALRSRRPLSLSALQVPPAQPDNEALWQSQAQTMTRYLLATFGVPPVMELARRLNDYPNFEAAYAAILGQPLNALLPDWEVWIFTEAAFQASTYSLFAPTTPTPTPSLTPSPTRLPPTATATLTPTREVTPTPRPTRTRIPPTPTATPLPPEAFVIRATPTPTPATTNTGLSFDNIPPLALGSLSLSALALIALIAYVVTRRR